MNKPAEAAFFASIATLNRRLDVVTPPLWKTRQLVGPFAVPFPDRSLLTQTIHGQKYFIDPDDLITHPQIAIDRQCEADIWQIFGSLSRPDLIVVANLIGVGARGQVIAFEPNQSLFVLLCRNRDINWLIAPLTLNEIALGEGDDQLVLHVPKCRGPNRSLTPPESMACDEIPVEVRRAAAWSGGRYHENRCRRARSERPSRCAAIRWPNSCDRTNQHLLWQDRSSRRRVIR